MMTSVKTICFINSNKVWGGGEKWHFEFSQRLMKEGYRIIAVTNRNSDLFFKLQPTGIPILPLKISNLSLLNPYKVIRLFLFLKKYDIHVVILGLSSDLKLAGIVSKLAKISRILYRRGSAIPVRNNILNRFLYKHILTGVIVNSLEIKRALLQNNSQLIEDNKIHLLYNCVDFQNFSTSEAYNVFKEKKNGEIWLGNVGRLVDQKGQMLLIDLAKILKDKNIKFKLYIAGIGSLAQRLKEYTATLNVENEVVFLGFVADMPAFMNNIDIFLLPSAHEGSANVLLEAMACSKPVVAFEVSSIGEIVEHNHTGFLAEFKNIENFANEVERFINDSQLRLQMGSNGKQRITEKFHIKETIAELKRIIEIA